MTHMGRDNHNAGLHLIWHKSNNTDYDNLKYYDSLSAQKKLQNGNTTIKSEPEYNVMSFNIGEIFSNASLVESNMFLIALREKTDLFPILSIVDSQMIDHFGTNRNRISLAASERAPFLSTIASNLHCRTHDLLFYNKRERKSAVYAMLDSIDDYEWNECFVDEETAAVVITLEQCSLFNHPSDSHTIITELPNIYLIRSLVLGKAVYELDFSWPHKSWVHFHNSGRLFAEEHGKLETLWNRLVRDNPTWL